MITKILNKTKEHLSYFREIYFWPIIAIAVVFGSIYGVVHLTGRSVTDDPGILVNFAYQFVGVIMTAILTIYIDDHAFHDFTREEWKQASAWEKALSMSKTLILFAIIAWCFNS